MATLRTLAAAWAGAALAVRARAGAACDGAEPSCQDAGRDTLLIQLSVTKASTHPCSFAVPPETPYYWDPDCAVGQRGCWADGVNAQCRYCSYDGVPCPRDAWRPSKVTCEFDHEPEGPFYIEPQCPEVDGGLGCRADGKRDVCRWCGGEGDYRSIECKVEQCTFANEPMIPYYYDEECHEGMIGCKADGVHAKCRFCGARPYDGVPCPADAQIPENACWFRNEPAIPYFWNENCTMGMTGCWADGIHEKCQFCSRTPGAGGAYDDIACP